MPECRWAKTNLLKVVAITGPSASVLRLVPGPAEKSPPVDGLRSTCIESNAGADMAQGDRRSRERDC